MKTFLQNALAAALMFAATSVSAATIDVAATGSTTLDPDQATLSGGSTKELNDGMNTFDSMKNGYTATFTLNFNAASKYTINFVAATKNSNVSMKFAFMSGEETLCEKTVEIENNGTWGSTQEDFKSYEFTTDEISTGEKTLVITFVGPKYTCNVGNMTITPFDASATTYSLTTVLNPEGAGAVNVSPSKDYFSPNESVTVTATSNVGYNFVSWTDATGTVKSTEATYTFDITENTTLTANYEEADLTITVPTTDENPFAMEYAVIDNHGDDRAKWADDHIDYMFSGFTATYTINNTTATDYDIAFQAATTNDGISVKFDIMSEDGSTTVASQTVEIENNDDWNDYQDYKASIKALPVGKYKLVVTFLNSAAEGVDEGGSYTTCNLKGISFNAVGGSDTGVDNAKVESAANGQIYDLSGRRVSQTHRGIYIQNGRKVIR